MVVGSGAAELEQAVALIVAGQPIGLPTETVYGLAADAGCAAAVARIYAIKGRPTDHPLIVHVADQAAARRWGRWTPLAEALAAAFWPGPLTLVLERLPQAAPYACAGQATIALRAPAHPVAQALLRRLAASGVDGLAAPSANRFGRVSPTRAADVRDDLGDDVPLVLDGGDAMVGIESTIVDATGTAPKVLRPGRITVAQLVAAQAAQGAAQGAAHPPAAGAPAAGMARAGHPGPTATVPRVPGSHRSHYAPHTPVTLLAVDALPAAISSAGTAGERVAVWSVRRPVGAVAAWRERPTTVAAMERTLYRQLRELDHAGCDRLLVERPPSTPDWDAINDRLGRAAAGPSPT